jgi:DNA-binding CsgD family transcriptional regulator
MGDNPLVVYTARTRDGSARKWSDFVTQRRLHATELWNGLFRPFGVERQMVALLPAPAPLLVGVVLNRCGHDFSERDRALLNLLRPHLVNAYRNAQARTILSALEGGTGNGGEAVVLFGALGEPLALTPRGRELLSAFATEQLLDWCGRMRSRAPLPAEPLLAAENGRSVEARMLAPSVAALRVVCERVGAASLQALGLSPREREVLALVAEGCTNKQIAARLDVLPATVKKHLERIYDKLDVRTRTGAAATAFRAAAA